MGYNTKFHGGVTCDNDLVFENEIVRIKEQYGPDHNAMEAFAAWLKSRNAAALSSEDEEDKSKWIPWTIKTDNDQLSNTLIQLSENHGSALWYLTRLAEALEQATKLGVSIWNSVFTFEEIGTSGKTVGWVYVDSTELRVSMCNEEGGASEKRWGY